MQINSRISIHAPARGATLKLARDTNILAISIHAPARGATADGGYDRAYAAISIHAPARGATHMTLHDSMEKDISIHAPARGATIRPNKSEILFRFQSTLPRGERHRTSDRVKPRHIHFNPRSREGSDEISTTLPPFPSKFQSTLPRGERQAAQIPMCQC